MADVSVVIPNYNGCRWLPGLLSSLGAQTTPAAETIVVDNASGDGSVAWLRATHPDVRVLALATNTGFAHAANRGIALAAGQFLALLNPDVELASDWLERMVARFTDPTARDVGAAACKMVSLADPGVIYDAGDCVRRDGACLQRGRGHRDNRSFDVPGEAFGACAGAAVYRRAALAAVDGFDERYFAYLEDADLALKLRAAGWRCAYEPAVARHAGEGASPRPGAHLRWVARNTPLLVARWFSPRWLGLVAYRQVALAVLAARERRLTDHLGGLREGLALVPGALRDRPAITVPRAELVPPQPIRGPAAAGHPAARAASWTDGGP